LAESLEKTNTAPRIEIVADEAIDKDFLTQIRTWANKVLKRTASPAPYLCLTVWKTLEKLQAYYREEKEALGVITGEETDFLATHEAWRGYPRIHICEEKLEGIPSAIVQGVVHHEISHALQHGTQEFYTFRFSTHLRKVERTYGLDLAHLQQCVYFLSVAIKDWEVVQGLAFSQVVLLEHLISDTDEERQVWEVAHGNSALRTIALAAFLKTLLPIEAMVSVEIEEAQALRNRWEEAYRWLPQGEREALFRLPK
jgi:hypothetical protein